MSNGQRTSIASWWAGLSLRDSLVLLVGSIAVAWYFCCIFFVGRGTIVTTNSATGGGSSILNISQETFDFMALSITTISGTLATFLGLVLGFGQVQSARNVRAASMRTLQMAGDSAEESVSESSHDDADDVARSPIDPRMLTRTYQAPSVDKPSAEPPASAATPTPTENLNVSWIQSLAACAYLASLVWALAMFVQDDTGQLAAVLQNLAKSTLGVIGGVLAVVLNVK